VRLDLLVSFFRNVDSSGFSCCLGATRQVDGVAEEAVPRHSVADHSGNNFTGVNPDCDPLNKIQYNLTATRFLFCSCYHRSSVQEDRFAAVHHVECQLGDVASVGGARLWKATDGHVLVPNSLHLDSTVNTMEEVTESVPCKCSGSFWSRSSRRSSCRAR
jgi:hypothetical protein